ncbi:MAG TPA: hypothetical protein QGI59_00060 [Candidatus Poseidoniia archaeon]|jgi:hypothetical protein|nr:hypothetical protein [Candidatus Poseidoniia archaeon]|tara:strand:+ start:7908 stop:8180 length:273 start_codon:yes stop_codon:yes gene_type:complete
MGWFGIGWGMRGNLPDLAKQALTFGSTKDPELAPHMYLTYLLAWTFVVGFFVLFIFPLIGNTFGFIIITLLILIYVSAVVYFHNHQIFAD